jgi:hypothetical protein
MALVQSGTDEVSLSIFGTAQEMNNHSAIFSYEMKFSLAIEFQWLAVKERYLSIIISFHLYLLAAFG